jgi:nucleotide-binding universal stress UspA family protein
MNATFKHILIPFDNSPSARVALRTAVNLSKKFKAQMTMVYANPDFEIAEDIMETMRTVKNNAEIDITLFQPKGLIYQEVIAVAESSKCDLIIMGTHGDSGIHELFVGSNAYRVVSSSSIPVLTMQESYKKDSFDTIVIPIDDSHETRQKIPMVRQIAGYFNSKVYILGCSKWETTDVRSRVEQYADQTKRLLEEADIECEIRHNFGGNIAEATMDYSEEIKADLIIAMSESEPAGGFFMGANAQRLVNHSDIPVLTIAAKDEISGVSAYWSGMN